MRRAQKSEDPKCFASFAFLFFSLLPLLPRRPRFRTAATLGGGKKRGQVPIIRSPPFPPSTDCTFRPLLFFFLFLLLSLSLGRKEEETTQQPSLHSSSTNEEEEGKGGKGKRAACSKIEFHLQTGGVGDKKNFVALVSPENTAQFLISKIILLRKTCRISFLQPGEDIGKRGREREGRERERGTLSRED